MSTRTSTLSPEARRKGIELVPELEDAVRKVLTTGQVASVESGYGLAVIKPRNPLIETAKEHDLFENVTIELHLTVRSYAIKKGLL